MSQMGVPYSWGGGNAAGPSNGIDSGAGTVGFDCSGLVLYAFAGVGIKLPHYSGSQYNMGRKIPSSQMRRGDVIFYGPGGSQHVTIYLGNGQMLEAPVHRFARQGLAGAHQRHDAVRRPVHRILMSGDYLRRKALRCAKTVALVLAVLGLLVGLAAPAAAEPEPASGTPRCRSSSAPARRATHCRIANASLAATAQATQITHGPRPQFPEQPRHRGAPRPVWRPAGSAAGRPSST